MEYKEIPETISVGGVLHEIVQVDVVQITIWVIVA